MGRAVFDDDTSFREQEMLAAAVLCRTEHGSLHMGLMYRGTDGGSEILHLAWNDKLSRDWPWRRMWACPVLEPERLRSLSGQCRQIWRRYQANRRFAYSLAYHGTSFDVSGQIKLGPGARGLTCASFVLALFKYVGIELINEDDWPVRTTEDLEFLASIEGIASRAHFDSLMREVVEGCKRIRPDEVLGACACVELPAMFAPTRLHADEIVARLP